MVSLKLLKIVSPLIGRGSAQANLLLFPRFVNRLRGGMSYKEVYEKLENDPRVAVLLLSTASGLFAQQPIVFKLAFTDPPFLKIGDLQVMHHSYAGMVAFKGALEKLSSGRIVVENYPYGRLGDANENMQQIFSGTLQGATPADGAVAPFYKDIQVFSIPYAFDSALDAYKLWDGPIGKAFFDDIAKTSGLRVLAIYDNGGFRSFSNNKKVIKTAADMKGLKLRTMTIPVHMEMVKALGASPPPDSLARAVQRPADRRRGRTGKLGGDHTRRFPAGSPEVLHHG